MKQQQLVVSLATLVLSVGLWTVTSRPVHALTLVPPSLEFSSQPGKTIDTTVKLFNETAEPINVNPSTALFTAKDELGAPAFDFKSKPSDLATWISVPNGPLGVRPNERIEIPIKITVPVDAQPGGHYAGLFFETVPGGDNPGQVKVKAKIGTLVIIRIEGDVRESGTVKEFSTSGSSNHASLPVSFVLRVANDGNVHFRPEGTVTIHNMFGGTTASIQINTTEGAVLPNSVRHYDVQWKKNSDKAPKGNFFQLVGDEWHNFAFGTYTAQLDATYGASKKALSATTRITIVPWHLLLLVIVLVIIVVVLLVLFIKWYNNMIMKRVEKKISSNTRSRS